MTKQVLGHANIAREPSDVIGESVAHRVWLYAPGDLRALADSADERPSHVGRRRTAGLVEVFRVEADFRL